MSKDLYFLPIIGDALRHPEPKMGLTAAIEEIKNLGKRPEYERGFLQFLRFMAEVRRNWEKRSQESGDFASQFLRRIPEIIVERNEKAIGSVRCESLRFTKEIRGLKPGHYVVRMDTGRILWQGGLNEQDLICPPAFQREALDLAADTGEIAEKMTREITLLNGELTIRFFSEDDSGRLELEIKDSKLG
jgi:hypothetical protein